MSLAEGLLRLHDLDLLIVETHDPAASQRLRQMGFDLEAPEVLERTRARLMGDLDPRWVGHYERARGRYGRGLVQVRGRACQGCFMTLATSAAPAAGESLTLCESCGRVLFWP
jgi:predicted  nucleic acid-binding Zn-ribbon protein